MVAGGWNKQKATCAITATVSDESVARMARVAESFHMVNVDWGPHQLHVQRVDVGEVEVQQHHHN